MEEARAFSHFSLPHIAVLHAASAILRAEALRCDAIRRLTDAADLAAEAFLAVVDRVAGSRRMLQCALITYLLDISMPRHEWRWRWRALP